MELKGTGTGAEEWIDKPWLIHNGIERNNPFAYLTILLLPC